jgi:hypothetical protein
MFHTLRLSLILGVLLLFVSTSASAQRFGGRGGYYPNHYRGRTVYVAPRVVYSPGRFYAGRGYFYGNRFWARPYYGVGAGIPFGYGYRTPRGCGYVDPWGRYIPAPCYLGY